VATKNPGAMAKALADARWQAVRAMPIPNHELAAVAHRVSEENRHLDPVTLTNFIAEEVLKEWCNGMACC